MRTACQPVTRRPTWGLHDAIPSMLIESAYYYLVSRFLAFQQKPETQNFNPTLRLTITRVRIYKNFKRQRKPKKKNWLILIDFDWIYWTDILNTGRGKQNVVKKSYYYYAKAVWESFPVWLLNPWFSLSFTKARVQSAIVTDLDVCICVCVS